MEIRNIHPGAKLGKDVSVGMFSSIADNVEIGDGTVIGENVVIKERVRIGKNCKIASHAVIGCDPQDLHYDNDETWVEIGDNNKILSLLPLQERNRRGGGKTVVGNNCMIMPTLI